MKKIINIMKFPIGKKHFLVLTGLVIIGIVIFAFPFVQVLRASAPNPGHSWNQMECDTNLCVNGAGSIGIGTSSPAYVLDVVGTGRFTQPVLVGTPTATGHAATKSYVDSAVATATSTQYWVASSTSIYYNGGNVGIGLTAPTSKFTTIKTANDTVSVANSAFWFGDNSLNAGLLGQQKLTAPYAFVLQAQDYTQAGSYFPLSLNPLGGNVGIGTTSPSTQLHVKSATNTTATLLVESPTLYYPAYLNLKVSTQEYSLGNGRGVTDSFSVYDVTNTKTPIVIEPNAGNNLLYLKSGNVGIGTTSPGQKLTVSGGNIQLENNYYLKGTDAGGTGQYIVGISTDSSTRLLSGSGDDIYIFPGNSSPVGMTIKATTGNVGIGTTSPGAKLEVANSTHFSMLVNSSSGANQQAGLDLKTSDRTWAIINDPFTSNSLIFYDRTGGAGNRMTINTSGNVGIGTTSPGSTLTVNGTAWVTSGAWSGSDIRWKKNITSLPLQGSLDKVMQLNPVSFDWRTTEFPDMHFSSSTQLGFIAQDVEKIIPEVVTTDNNGYKGISYERIAPMLTAAIQEQQKQIEELKIKNEKLESRIKLLENR